MYAYILKRIMLMVPTLIGVMLVTFVVTQFVPGGPVEQLINKLEGRGAAGEVAGSVSQKIYRGDSGLDSDKLETLKKLYGFDKPAYQRFTEMLVNYFQFKFGDSYYYQQSVLSLIISKMPVSATLGLWTFFIVYLTCIPLGIKKAVRDGTRFDVTTSTIILVGYAIPGFVLGIMLLVLLGGGSFWDVFPLSGLTSDNWDQLGFFAKIGDYLWHITLPVTAYVVGSFAVLTMLTKNSFIEEIRKQYVTTARAKGLTENTVLYKHVFRNAIIPLVTSFPSAFVGAFFTGSLLIETTFSLDGLGLLSYNAIINRDYPIVLGTLFIFTLIGLILKLVTDICYVLVDPRIQFESLER